ncbi:MAG: zinc-dependent alcohol dehydrogenase [Rhodospirillaceae bacterium]
MAQKSASDAPNFGFILHPHQDKIRVPEAAINYIPQGVPPRRAILAANMETAVNGVWDGGAGPGDHIAVIGGGVVGLLTAWLAGRIPGTQVTLCDINPTRAPVAEALGVKFCHPEQLSSHAHGLSEASQDLVFHASASEAGLATALSLAGPEAKVVEMSWYGDKPISAPLGAAFHPRRLSLISSQVGNLPTERRPRWSYGRRMALALSLLADPVLDCLITEEVPFEDLPARLPDILAPDAQGLMTAVRYR